MTPQTPLFRMHDQVRYVLASLLLLLLAAPAYAQEKPKPAPAEPANTATVVLSPFVVTSASDKGYFASNTLAGSRMSTNIADLGASISVITKQQLEDTASLDINDVFRYEINTEGSSTYTPTGSGYLTLRSDGVLDVNGGSSTGSSTTPFTNASANRVRGIGVPSSATNYFPTIGQVPFDAYNVSSIEISRGPNSMLFGLGSPAGIVNQSTAQAQTDRNSANVSLRFDQYGSNRGSFSFNRKLIDDKLAIYGAFLHDDRKFDRKPSYDRTTREYAAITYKPTSKTTLRANFENYDNQNRRPNTLTPRDFVTQWNLAGQPYYDPLTRQIVRFSDNKVVGDYVINASSPLAAEARNFIQGMPNYNPALWNAAKTTYNGVTIFGEAALTTSNGFSALNNTASTNAMFVPGITWVNQPRTTMQIADGQLVNWFQPLFNQKYRTEWGKGGNPAATADAFPTDAAIWANPTWSSIDNRDYTSSNGWTGIGNNIIGYKYAGVTDKAIYDWTKTNINQMNFGHDKNRNFNLELEQRLTDDLFLSAGWFRQDFHSSTNYTVAQLNVATLFVDTNKNLPDGRPNPFFGKPYVEDTDPDRYVNNELDDHYRAMLAWTPDFTRQKGWLKWLGHHQILGLWSRDKADADALRQRLEYVDSSSLNGKIRYMANQNNNADGTPTGWNFQTTSLRRAFYLASPGDPTGVVTRSSGEWNYDSYVGDIKVYDYANSKFDTVNLTTKFNTFDASTAGTQRLVDSISGGATSYWWNDRLITTFGVRQDKYKARLSTNGVLYRQDLSTGDATKDVDLAGKPVPAGQPVPVTAALTNAQKWINGSYDTATILDRFNRWDRLTGTTRTLGGVFRPFRNWQGIDGRANAGSLWWQFVRDFGVSYNKSDNFNPPPTAQVDAFGKPLPKPTGAGKDYGFQFALFNNKLFARVTWFEGSNLNERTAAGTSISRLTDNVDQTLFRNWARTIVLINMGQDPRQGAFGTNLDANTEAAVQAGAEKIWKLPYAYYQSLPGSIGATRNALAKGVEAEINYNPTRNWTMKFTFGKQDTKYSRVLTEFEAWYNIRFPVWTAAKAADYLLPQYQGLASYTTTGGGQVDLTNFLTSYGYNSAVSLTDQFGNTNVTNYYNNVVVPQVLLARDLNGQSSPGQRKYRWSFLTNYAFTEGKLKGFSVGGVERWEDKSVIGYYGKVSGSNGIQMDVSDTTRPIFDSARFYTDLMVSYTRPIWHDAVKMKLQLNCVNALESGRLQTVSVNFDGSPYAFRIVDPRQFILSASFDF